MRRRFALALTGILAVLGLAFTAAPASAAPAQGDDVGIQATVGQWRVAVGGAVTGGILNNQLCTPIPPSTTVGELDALGVAMGVRVALFDTDPANPICNLGTWNGVIIAAMNPTLTLGANFYSTI